MNIKQLKNMLSLLLSYQLETQEEPFLFIDLMVKLD